MVEGSNPFDGLTDAEGKVAEKLAEGMHEKDIALALFMGEGTVKTHVADIYSKLGITHGRVEYGRLWERWHPAR